MWNEMGRGKMGNPVIPQEFCTEEYRIMDASTLNELIPTDKDYDFSLSFPRCVGSDNIRIDATIGDISFWGAATKLMLLQFAIKYLRMLGCTQDDLTCYDENTILITYQGDEQNFHSDNDVRIKMSIEDALKITGETL